MYEPGKVLKSGGRHDVLFSAIPDASVIDLNAVTPTWEPVNPMSIPRTDHNLVVLPDSKILAIGGTNDAGHVYAAEMFDPNDPDAEWQQLAVMTEGRAYHSTAVLLPDARVLAAGETASGSTVPEIFTPPYLQGFDPRPLITLAPSGASYNVTFNVRVSEVLPPVVPAGQIAKVSLVRLAADTHGFDQDQRCVPLSFTVVNSVTLRVATPTNTNDAPPGFYMLFLVSQAGVPSMARYFQLNAP